jgi:hypothetical protein
MIKKPASFLSLLLLFSLQLNPAYAALVSTAELLDQQSRNELIEKLERRDIQAQMVELGVDPQAALDRVEAMTDQEIAQLNGQLAALPAGGELSTLEWLLIIVIILILV